MIEFEPLRTESFHANNLNDHIAAYSPQKNHYQYHSPLTR